MLTFFCSTVVAQLLDQTADNELAVQQLTHDYFAAKDSRDYRKAYAFLSPSDQKEVPFENWKRIVDRFNQQAGPVTSRLITRITWYRNPPNVAPGLYCTVDFVGTFKNIDKLSGYLACHLESDGKFLIVREEQNYIGEKTGRTTTSGT